MKNILHKRTSLLPFIVSLLLYATGSSQGLYLPVKGWVKDSTSGAGIGAVSVTVKNSTQGTFTTPSGHFNLHVKQLPALLQFSAVGYATREMEITDTSMMEVQLPIRIMETPEVQVFAGRIPSRLMDASSSIERMTAADFQSLPAPSYYDNVSLMKGVDMVTSSLTFKSMSTRGFNGSGSARVNQRVDDIDNQAPGLNFFLGGFVGLTPLDVDNVELLPGASSALYGPGGMNGTILIRSRDPFKYKGLSIDLKQGMMNLDKTYRNNITNYADYSLRFAHAFNEKFAFKVGAQYVKGTDWLAADSSNYLRMGATGKVIPGNRQSDPNYDGVNVYGDETKIDLRLFLRDALPPEHQFLKNPIMVSRTGYAERDVIDPETKNIKLSGAMHYRLNAKLEAILSGYWATGNTIYSGSHRYVLKDIQVGQYKAELKHKNWFLRGFTTQEDAGEAYSATAATQITNEAWKRSFDPANIMGSWYPQYIGAFMQALATGASMEHAHQAARTFADQGRPSPGSPEFKAIFDKVRATPIPQGGLFLEKSQLWMGEGQYNFTDKIKFVDLLVGANVKKYILDSDGTIFIDSITPIRINEWGAYVQASKKLMQDKLILTASVRYDKNENFEGRPTPRFSAVLKPARNHSIRLSYQTSYRFPTTQQQFIRLDVGEAILLGGLPWIKDWLQLDKNPAFKVINETTLVPYTYQQFKPETMRSFEIGYKAWMGNRWLIDAYGYYGNYDNFLGRVVLVQPGYRSKPVSIVENSKAIVKTVGAGLSVDYKASAYFNLFANGYFDKITDQPAGFNALFNTPRYRANAGLVHNGIDKKRRLGFGITAHWQDTFNYESDFATGTVPAYFTMDGSIHYKIPKAKTTIKLGASNLLNNYYMNAFGNPQIGGLYYINLGFGL